jgi:hypothetical protein
VRDRAAHRHLRPAANGHDASAQPDVQRHRPAILPYWESMEPVPVREGAPAAGIPGSAVERTEMALGFLDVAMPEFKRMHEMTVDHVHEEIQLLAIDVSTMLFETIAPCRPGATTTSA